MNKAAEPVIIPADNPTAFDLDWRYKLAANCEHNTDLPMSVIMDPDLVTYTAHRRARAQGMARIKAFDRVEEWHDHEIGFIIEGALLTPATNAKISRIIGADEEEIRLYSALFFNIRDKNGNVIPGIMLRLRLQDDSGFPEARKLARRAALAGGFNLLCSVFGLNSIAPRRDIDDADFPMVLANAEIVKRILAGGMSNADLGRVITAGTMREKYLEESGVRGQSAREQQMFETLMCLLKQFAPTIYVDVLSAEQKVDLDAQLQAKFASQKDLQNNPLRSALDEDRSRAWLDGIMPKRVEQIPAVVSGTVDGG